MFQATTASSSLTLCNVTNSRAKSAKLVISSIGSAHQAPFPQDIPPKVIKKILNLEHVEMAELLPEYWGQTNLSLIAATTKQAKHHKEARLQTF